MLQRLRICIENRYWIAFSTSILELKAILNMKTGDNFSICWSLDHLCSKVCLYMYSIWSKNFVTVHVLCMYMCYSCVCTCHL